MKKRSLQELHRVSVEQFKQQPKIPVVVILDNIRSMHNVGSVFRTADAFAIDKIYLCGITACPPNKEINKTALGATESVTWEYQEDALVLIKKLQQEQYKVFAAEQTDKSVLLPDLCLHPDEKIALILGNEVFGVDDRLLPSLDGAIEIPQFGTKHSLNVSVAAGIILWHLSQIR
ncbi:MAG: RNA methyltransferase [Bacteroidales bacterium]|jgi:tRNA G18 (ribose-2'-O)-methylase SpoU|nr:RNA methyltransferase [Bacteroidales bacterium]